MSDVSDSEIRRQDEDDAPWGEEEKRLRTIRQGRQSRGECIMCGKPLGYFDKRAKRIHHTNCENFKE